MKRTATKGDYEAYCGFGDKQGWGAFSVDWDDFRARWARGRPTGLMERAWEKTPKAKTNEDYYKEYREVCRVERIVAGVHDFSAWFRLWTAGTPSRYMKQAGWAGKPPVPTDDQVNFPPHYTTGGMETIDVIKAKLTPDEFRGYLLGAILKYTTRFNHKGKPKQDLLKAQWYLARLIEEVEAT